MKRSISYVLNRRSKFLVSKIINSCNLTDSLFLKLANANHRVLKKIIFRQILHLVKIRICRMPKKDSIVALLGSQFDV